MVIGIAPGVAALQADSFYGKALSTGVREYLELRKATAQGPATVNDIYRALCYLMVVAVIITAFLPRSRVQGGAAAAH